MLSIKTGPTSKTWSSPLGAFQAARVSNLIHTRFHMQDNGIPVFLVHGELKKKDRSIICKLANLAREIVGGSIYRGRAHPIEGWTKTAIWN